LIDGVFAIALTLLVLDLPRRVKSTHLVNDLQQHWPTYAAHLVSFATLGIAWIEHHAMTGAVHLIDRRFSERTLVFLLFVSVIAWPSALAAHSVDAGTSDARDTAILYAATLLMMGLGFAWSWRYLSAPGTGGASRSTSLPCGYPARPFSWSCDKSRPSPSFTCTCENRERLLGLRA
jgi:uncharacterized membrane protein